MSDSENVLPISLTAELRQALGNATSRALTALDSLCLAVQDHVENEKARGQNLSQIDDGLRAMIDSCTDALDGSYSADRADDVRRQVLKWSTSFYRPVS